jgi:chromate transporter
MMSLMQMNLKTDNNIQANEISLVVLFLSFLKIGATSWGGFMAIISVVQKELVEKKALIEEKVIFEGVSLASVLPGPMAFNVVVYIGYYLKGIKGAIVSMLGILLPSFLFMLILSYIYLKYGELPAFENFFKGVLPAVVAIIISVALNMAKKNIKDYKQIIICLVVIAALVLLKSVFIALFIILSSAFLGYLLYGSTINTVEDTKTSNNTKKSKPLIYAITVVSCLAIFIWFLPYFLAGKAAEIASIQKDIIFTLSTISVTLFGGGYVIIPIMHDIIVSGLHWLSQKEFVDAIAMGQLTPGPIFISATFIGFKVGGFLGAITATLAIFIPSGLIMIIVSQFFDQIKNSKFITAAFKGLRPAIVGMILASAYTIGAGVPFSWFSLGVFMVVLFASLKYEVNVAFLIPLAGIAGILFFNFI